MAAIAIRLRANVTGGPAFGPDRIVTIGADLGRARKIAIGMAGFAGNARVITGQRKARAEVIEVARGKLILRGSCRCDQHKQHQRGQHRNKALRKYQEPTRFTRSPTTGHLQRAGTLARYQASSLGWRKFTRV